VRFASKIWKPVATMIVPTVISLSSSFCLKSIAFRSPQAATHVFLHLPVFSSMQVSGSMIAIGGMACGNGRKTGLR
jgi:hypothetical protein